jgi:hypothetical protein
MFAAPFAVWKLINHLQCFFPGPHPLSLPMGVNEFYPSFQDLGHQVFRFGTMSPEQPLNRCVASLRYDAAAGQRFFLFTRSGLDA